MNPTTPLNNLSPLEAHREGGLRNIAVVRRLAAEARQGLEERLRLYAQLTEKYNAPQTVWSLDEWSTMPPIQLRE